MTPQQIKDNAPEGATHYYINKNSIVYYFRVLDDIAYFWNYDLWSVTYRSVNLEPLPK